jgi:magnesium transporter
MTKTNGQSINQELVRDITYHTKDRLERFRSLPLKTQSAVFEKLSPHVQQCILEKLNTDEVLQLLDHFDLQKAENTLARIRNQKRREKLALRLKSDLKEKAEYFLRFHPKAELNLLNFNYLLLPEDTTIGEASDAIDEHYREVGKLPEVLVHKNGECIGEVKPSILIRESNRKKLSSFVSSVPTVSYQAELDEVVQTFKETKHGKVTVLDTDGSVVGIIYADDALKLFGSDPAASLYDFAGVADSERARDGMWSKVKHRYKWLIINLGTGFLAASAVSLFENTLNELVLLAIYMPIVAGMGGNAATQTLAVIVRGITVGEVALKNSVKPILNEVGAGMVNGAINGVLIALVATFWNESPMLGVVLGIAMVVNLIIAGFFGAFIPLLMKAMGKDPATSATIFITTATDVFGFFVFLGLATVILL